MHAANSHAGGPKGRTERVHAVAASAPLRDRTIVATQSHDPIRSRMPHTVLRGADLADVARVLCRRNGDAHDL